MKQIKENLIYEKQTGKVRWLKNQRGGVKAGDLAGYAHPNGYRYIKYKQKAYAEHRLAWFLYYGIFPTGEVDHIDRNKTNNKINNLRIVTREINAFNRNKPKNNKSGLVGVIFNKKRRCWRSYIGVDGKQKHLGYFKNKQEAIDARKKAEDARNKKICP